MNKNYYNYSEEAKTGIDCIKGLFSHTDANGVLSYIEYHNDENVNDEDAYYDASMTWKEYDIEDTVSEFTTLCEQLHALANSGDYSSDAELNAVYNKYLAPIDVGDLDMKRIDEIGQELFLDAGSVSDEDLDYYEKWKVLFREEANKRLGKNAFSAKLLNGVRRYYRLIELDAPEMIRNIEEVKLAKEFTMYKFCYLECETYKHI